MDGKPGMAWERAMDGCLRRIKTKQVFQFEQKRGKMKWNIAIILLPLSLTGCATAVATNATSVQVVTPSQKESECKSLGIISVEQRIGPNKPGNAMNKALNEVAARGGNGIYIISSNVDWAEGASVTAEAMKCEFK